MSFKCDRCEKEFNTQQGLDQHKLDKHGMSSHQKKELKKEQHQETKKGTSGKIKRKKMMKYVVIVVVLAAVVGSAAYLVSTLSPSSGGNSNDDILSYNLYTHTNMALHIHPKIKIEINGREQVIPANIGISGSAMRVIHTHDDTGAIHIEAPVPHTFQLRDFFTIWGKNFNASCIFEYCANETHELRVFLNSQPSSLYETLPLRDLDNIRIVYGPKEIREALEL